MSSGRPVRHRSTSASSKNSSRANKTKPIPPPTTLTPENTDGWFEPCAATASFLLYAQRNQILVLHHDTLAIDRRFDLHREDVLWVQVDNVSERGFGRLAVSYDAGNTAIVWDILTGGEVARFTAYEHMRVASFMRNGNIAFGNDQGSIILFEPSTSEHISARTIFDPVTAIAPSSDCRTFAIGYLNGSILVATLQPSFTILHTLTTNRAPSRITGLAWHGSSSKQKTDMLATQTSDGDLRVWSVPKIPHHDLVATIIRVLQRGEVQGPGSCWFAWSKNGRIVQYAEGETRSWDVRTKRVTYEVVPTVDGIIGMACYGPTASLFTLGRNHTVQQYDITPNVEPMQVATVQHVPSVTPPTPPTILEPHGQHYADPHKSSVSSGAPAASTDADSSADESGHLSPLQKIAQEMDSLDALESEIRDKVMPLSPSSKASSASSRSSRDSRRARRYLYDAPESSRGSSATNFNGTDFSLPEQARTNHESISIRSVSSFASRPQHRSSSLRKEIMRSPEETKAYAAMDLFPFTKARLREVDFRTPHYGDGLRTPELLQREMLSTVFGWNDDVKMLIQDELSRHRSGAASAVLLAKWLGDVGADSMASMVGSESMTSSDWMLLALSSIGKDSQKKVGEAFVQRLLEKGDIHPAVAILLGLGEYDDAIEVYVSQGYWMESLLLACLTSPTDWKRQAFLLRKWGEVAVQQGQAELAVRCFSCAAAETSQTWFSPRAQQDAAFAAQQKNAADPLSAGPLSSPPISPPSRSASGRLTAKNASLKLITTFEQRTSAAPVSANPIGTTPIAESALTPGGAWRQARHRGIRDPSSARTATPGDFTKRKRLPSRDQIERAKQEAAELVTPMTAARDFAAAGIAGGHRRRASNASSTPEPATAVKATSYQTITSSRTSDHLPSPGPELMMRLREQSRPREDSRDRNTGRLAVDIVETRYTERLSPAPTNESRENSMHSPSTNRSRQDNLSPSLTDKNGKNRAINEYISSVEEARVTARRERAHSKKRGESRKRDDSRAGRGSSRTRERSVARGRDNVRYIKPAKRSPSSPVPMSPEEIAQASQRAKQEAEPATTDDESFYKLASPIDTLRSPISRPSSRQARITSPINAVRSPIHEPESGHARVTSPIHSMKSPIERPESRQARGLQRETSRSRENLPVPTSRARGRSDGRGPGAIERSPSLPLPISPEKKANAETDDTQSDGQRFRIRAASSDRQMDDLQSRRAASRDERARSKSRRREPEEPAIGLGMLSQDISKDSIAEETGSVSSLSTASGARRKGSALTKELAARELEERRLSLARRPSAPTIPMPGELRPSVNRPNMAPRSNTELGDSPRSTAPPMSNVLFAHARSHTVDPEAMTKYNNANKAGAMLPPFGLPATPRAMRQPRHMGADSSDREGTPPVPDIPGGFSEFSSGGSVTGSALSQAEGSALSQASSSVQPSQVWSLQQPSQVSTGLSQVSSGPSQLSSLSNQSKPREEADNVGPLLPSTTFVFKPGPPPRSASAPIDASNQAVHPAYKPSLPSTRRLSAARQHVRKISPPDNPAQSVTTQSISSIEGTMQLQSDNQIIVIQDSSTESLEPPILPELQHLAGPPPPPPPPTMYQTASIIGSDVISIGIDGSSASELSSVLGSTTYPTSTPAQYPAPMERATTASPSTSALAQERIPTGSPTAHHRRGRGSIGETVSFGSRLRGVTERMRSQSRNRTKSPTDGYKPSPYESVLPPVPSRPAHSRRESLSNTGAGGGERAKSPYEQALSAGEIPPPPPPPMPTASPISEKTIPPTNLPSSRSGSTQGYRNPKEIRANMPPETLQQGVFQAGNFL